MKIRTIIVDDEPLGRERLRKLLAIESDVEIVAECGDGREAIATIQREAPQLVFLDVQMPEIDGFGVVAGLTMKPAPIFVFVTAYDKFALRAFDAHALDYLLKPFDKARFQKALEKVRVHLKAREMDQLSARLTTLIEEVKEGRGEKQEVKAMDRFAVKTGGKVLLLKIDDIDWIEAADNYINIHIGVETHMQRETMVSIEGKLPPARFVRINRSTIVNIERVKELQPLFHGDQVVILHGGTKLTLSRNYRDKLNHLLGRTE
ncbi:MAG: response regulator transcription factor [Pedosphaera sp.]|nr:response regulator transcription factor [Pedosphaera sp.]